MLILAEDELSAICRMGGSPAAAAEKNVLESNRLTSIKSPKAKMAEDLQPEKTTETSPGADGELANLTAGGVLLPRFIIRGDDGLFVDLALLESTTNFQQFADRVFTADAYFSDLNYPLFFRLLYPSDDKVWREQKARQELRLARDIKIFSPGRKEIYHKVKISAKGDFAEYYFEPVSIDQEVEEPVFGAPDEDGNTPIIGYEKVMKPVRTQLDLDEFIAAMWTKGIRFGIDIEMVREAIAKDGTERLQIARWQESVAGIDAGIDEQSDTLHRDNSPRELANGRIDLRQFKNHFPQVEAETRLLKKSPRQLGELGWSVRGAPIEPAMPKDFEIETLAGPGTKIERTAEGEFIVAAITGFVNLDIKSNQISVNEKIINRHGISLRTTGDLSLSGADFEEHGEVQERRVVKGHNMTFLADVFGQVISDGGIVNLKDGLAGGSARNPGGKIVISGTASRAAVEAKGGEIEIVAAENCIVVASKVHIVRAVNCEILAEEVEIETCEGCAVAGKAVRIADVGSRKGTETVVTSAAGQYCLEQGNRGLEAEGGRSHQGQGEKRARNCIDLGKAGGPEIPGTVAESRGQDDHHEPRAGGQLAGGPGPLRHGEETIRPTEQRDPRTHGTGKSL